MGPEEVARLQATSGRLRGAQTDQKDPVLSSQVPIPFFHRDLGAGFYSVSCFNARSNRLAVLTEGSTNVAVYRLEESTNGILKEQVNCKRHLEIWHQTSVNGQRLCLPRSQILQKQLKCNHRERQHIQLALARPQSALDPQLERLCGLWSGRIQSNSEQECNFLSFMQKSP